MLFAFNNAVFDLGDPAQTYKTMPEKFHGATLKEALRVTQGVIMEYPDVVKTHPQKAMALAALVACRAGDANAMMAFVPPGTTVSQNVVVRLASVSLVVLQSLFQLHNEGKLSKKHVNAMVWKSAP